MNIDDVHKNWTTLGNDDPMWVILTDPTKKGNKWEKEEFFETGRREVRGVLDGLEGGGIKIVFGRALDFGCGIGRLSQALAQYFDKVDGVDVSSSMIEQARKLNSYPEKVEYHLNVREDLGTFASAAYDFIYSVISLHHVPSKFQIRYLSDFMRLLKPGGVAYFQTIHTHKWRRLVPNFVADLYRKVKHRGRGFIPLYGVPVSRVRRIVTQGGASVKRQKSEPYLQWESRFVNDVYVVTKNRAA